MGSARPAGRVAPGIPGRPPASVPGMSEQAVVCQNIGRKGRRMRMRIGVIQAVIAVVLLGGLMVAGVPWGWRLLAALPAMGAAIGILQARRSVCVAHAASGKREDDEMNLSTLDVSMSAAIKAQARGIWSDAALVGFAAGAVGALSSLIH
jgi:hypothetical protein